MPIAFIAGIRRYPVKSMLGEEIDASPVTERGLFGDRAYALLDRATGKIASAKHPRLWGQLLTCRAAIEGWTGDSTAIPTIRISLPNGSTVVTGRDDVDAALRGLLGRDVALLRVAPAAAEIERYWPDIEGMSLRDTFTSGTIGQGAPPGTFFDYAPLHLLTTASLDRLPATGLFDARRFRPNLIVAPIGAAEGFIENAWVGQTLLIGPTVRVRVTDPTPRCVVPTLSHGELPRDVGVLRAVATHNRPPIPALGGAVQPSLGVYATVERGGSIRRGDLVRLARDQAL
ncbi:MAG TPA: MOSC domain-containing protein [Chloroflexota bacterium]|jgi:hypothetical protein|nr:MOSC domain-containing protein [Chloroflexota bacterium]